MTTKGKEYDPVFYGDNNLVCPICMSPLKRMKRYLTGYVCNAKALCDRCKREWKLESYSKELKNIDYEREKQEAIKK